MTGDVVEMQLLDGKPEQSIAPSGPRRLRAFRQSLVFSAVFLAAFVTVYIVFVRTADGQLVDSSSFGAVGDLNSRWSGQAGWLRDQIPLAAAAVAAVFLVIALEQRRRRVSTVAVGLFLACAGASWALKDLLPRPYLGNFGYDYNTYPAGQTTIIASLGLIILMLLPATWERVRWLVVAVALVLTALTGSASVVTFAHRPSDVIGSVLLVGILAVPAAAVSGVAVVGRWPVWVAVAPLSLLVASAVLYLSVRSHIGTSVPSSNDLQTNLAPLCAVLGVAGLVYVAIAFVTRRERRVVRS